MNTILSRPAKRFFTFGCSFTNYEDWPTWANIIASELQLPFWNYGQGGAGNQYIFNMVMQADAMHQFNSDDVVMICWSGITREDRYIDNQWHCYGNIFNNPAADALAMPKQGVTPWLRAQKYLANWGDAEGFLVRDLAFIKATVELLKMRGCQIEQFCMKGLEIAGEEVISTTPINDMLDLIYGSYMKQIRPSFFEVLWNNDLEVKVKWNKERTNRNFKDLHPHPIEHLNYIEKVLNYKFSDRVRSEVEATQTLLENEIREQKVNTWITVPISYESQPRRGLYQTEKKANLNRP